MLLLLLGLTFFLDLDTLMAAEGELALSGPGRFMVSVLVMI